MMELCERWACVTKKPEGVSKRSLYPFVPKNLSYSANPCVYLLENVMIRVCRLLLIKYYEYLPRIAFSMLIALLSMMVLRSRSKLYVKLPHLSYGIHSAQSDNPEGIAVHADPMRVRTHIVWKIQALSS